MTKGVAFDAILCDVHMPDTSGLELVAALRVALPAAAKRVIFMTGDPQGASLGAMGSAACLPKPFTRSDLQRAIGGLGASSRPLG
jgi:CheY-like chemotaxis protein